MKIAYMVLVKECVMVVVDERNQQEIDGLGCGEGVFDGVSLQLNVYLRSLNQPL